MGSNKFYAASSLAVRDRHAAMRAQEIRDAEIAANRSFCDLRRAEHRQETTEDVGEQLSLFPH